MVTLLLLLLLLYIIITFVIIIIILLFNFFDGPPKWRGRNLCPNIAHLKKVPLDQVIRM
jgi:hypothetical protein